MRLPNVVGAWAHHPDRPCAGNSGFFVSESPTAQEAAKVLCRACPVQAECFDHALAAREAYGVWGGTTETERRPMLARLARIA